MSIFGENIKVSIFGESHGEGIGAVIDGLPAGIEIDEGLIAVEMARRAPGSSSLTTSRKEADQIEIISGFFNGKTTGAPLCGLIRNTNTRSRDYTPNLPRPGHSDLTAYLKYGGNADYRGGGHFSGRLTAPLVFAGAICRQILESKGVTVHADIIQIGKITGSCLTPEMESEILAAKEANDSVGGIIQCFAEGVPVGLGAPFFGSMESKISAMMYAIPAVIGVEFGAGFTASSRRGSEINDPIRINESGFFTETNSSGGINGGITNGMPIVFRVAIKPTPSIGLEQKTVDLNTMQNSSIKITGRHDPCIVPRAVPVVEAGLAICILDSMGD